MVDSISFLDKAHILQVFVTKLRDLKIMIPEPLQFCIMIAKLPFPWHDYRKRLLHIAEDFTLGQFQKQSRTIGNQRIEKKFSDNRSILCRIQKI